MEQTSAILNDQTNRDPILLAKKIMSLESKIKSGLATFSVIGTFSLINTFAYNAGGKFTFVIGLGITQLIDLFVKKFNSSGSGNYSSGLNAAFFASLFISVGFMILGNQAQKRKMNIILVGLILYALDAVIFLFTLNWTGLLFHLWFLYSIWTGYRALSDLQMLEAAIPVNELAYARQMVTVTGSAKNPGVSKNSKTVFNTIIIFVVVSMLLLLGFVAMTMLTAGK